MFTGNKLRSLNDAFIYYTKYTCYSCISLNIEKDIMQCICSHTFNPLNGVCVYYLHIPTKCKGKWHHIKHFRGLTSNVYMDRGSHTVNFNVPNLTYAFSANQPKYV